MEDNKKYFIMNFTNSLINLVNLVLKKSQEANIEILDHMLKQNKAKCDQHVQLRSVCKALKQIFEKTKSNEQVDIIKKTYRNITNKLKYMYPERNIELFTPEHGHLIPNLNINLVVSSMNENELKTMWGNLFMIYISAAELICVVNKKEKTGEKWEIIDKLKDLVVEFEIIPNKRYFSNPFASNDTDESGEGYNMEKMYSNVDKLNKRPTGDICNMINMDSMFNIEEITKQLQNLSDEDMNSAREGIANMLGANVDSKTNKLLGSMVNDIVGEMKGGKIKSMEDIIGIAKNVAGNAESKYDKNDFIETAKNVHTFMENGQNNLKSMKKPDGTPMFNGEDMPGNLDISKLFNPEMLSKIAQSLGQQAKKK